MPAAGNDKRHFNVKTLELPAACFKGEKPYGTGYGIGKWKLSVRPFNANY